MSRRLRQCATSQSTHGQAGSWSGASTGVGFCKELMLGLGGPAMARLLRASVTLGAQESAAVDRPEALVPPDAARRPRVSLPLQLWDDPYRWLQNPMIRRLSPISRLKTPTPRRCWFRPKIFKRFSTGK